MQMRNLVNALWIGIILLTGACFSLELPSPKASVACNFEPEGPDLYVRCSNGSWFVGSSKGGWASGQDGRGNELSANIALSDGRYSIADVLLAR